jgi:D-glycero-D-manno-heptose 1,7-bisphosphate phosphatase
MQGREPRPAVFLDRDGTINEQMGYINHISRFHLLPGAAEAIQLLNDNRIPVIVVSNQSGLARGYFSRELLDAVHEKMERLLAEQGARVDGVYFCPHHPEAAKEEFRRHCSCRKPGTGMLEQAAKEMNLDLQHSFLVGDRWTDLRCAAKAGCTPVLVLTGYGRGDYRFVGPGQDVQPEFVGEDLLQAATWIVHRMKEEKKSPTEG